MMAGRLVEVLSVWEAFITPGVKRAIWGVYAPKKVVSPKVRAFLGFMELTIGKRPYWDVVAGR